MTEKPKDPSTTAEDERVAKETEAEDKRLAAEDAAKKEADDKAAAEKEAAEKKSQTKKPAAKAKKEFNPKADHAVIRGGVGPARFLQDGQYYDAGHRSVKAPE